MFLVAVIAGVGFGIGAAALAFVFDKISGPKEINLL